MSSDDLSDVAWDKTDLPATMSRGQLEGVNTVMLALTSLVFVARVLIRVTKRNFEMHDFFCYLSYICYLAMWVMYLKENGPLYRAEGMQRGEIPPYPDILMFLPFRMTWNLQMPRTQKLGVFVLFGSGWICVLFATLRVVQVGVKDGVPKSPDPKWLQMWTVIETSMGTFFPLQSVLHSPRFGTQNAVYERTTYNVKMKSVRSGSTGQRKRKNDSLYTDTHGSEEVLAHYGGHITVPTEVH
ncbi:hypothetical protein P153DRAFT_373712 [Dothidotthia symphoricarpi CBS 119687]|uniref:Rhodopsin domain-containing protein n=1 Tax=Dothidotthia symphoricarpi CBS 119687 TaxID=1392245 RepID=A0A6A6AJW4_9PLEO|nr:uncharacterized protein P153DRAFT_373712 [Dothidotthia symphoricarpi CBS 119687]KAF2131846.1 hypothetical protein P153DRAFT_373712 [Dothidotthia symphoricarpi CBS 119687]